MSKIWEKGVKCILALGFTAIVMFVAGCSDDNAAPPATTGTGSITSNATTGAVAAGTTVAAPAGVTSLTFASSSVLTDSSGAPVTGAITTTVTQSTSASSLPAAAPTGTSLAVLLDIDMSKGATKVKNFSTPMTVVVAVPAGVTSVNVYSFNGTSWVLEQAGVAVSGGNATFNISHLSVWACFYSPSPLTVTSASPLPAGAVGTAYNQTLAASGGTAPYTWTIAAGSSLPAGLTLSTAGIISGTPTTAATTNFTVSVADSATPAGTATKALSITVAATAPTLPAAPAISAATGGTNSVTITWNAVTGATSYNLYWSTATGVTTTNGTKITLGNITSTKHSRLTATPTWLAANTPYFYIVTAVNANGESTPSAQATATTSATDGVALYGTNCSGCHPALSNPGGKHGRSAATIQAAINAGTGGMGSLSSLTAPQVQAIADVLVTGF